MPQRGGIAEFFDSSSYDHFCAQVSLGYNQSSVEPGDNITLQIATDPLSQVHLLAVDQSVLLMATGNDITQGDVSQVLLTIWSNAKEKKVT